MVEGASDEGMARSILIECGLMPGIVSGRHGKDHIKKKIRGYNHAAKRIPWFVLVDLDDPNSCPAELCNIWLPEPGNFMVLRVAVVEMESWLMADREMTATFLGVAISKVPTMPDGLPDPKQYLINLARRSRKREIREGLVPRIGSGALVGPTYASDIGNFGRTQWRPNVAAQNSPSLARCIARLRELAARLRR